MDKAASIHSHPNSMFTLLTDQYKQNIAKARSMGVRTVPGAKVLVGMFIDGPQVNVTQAPAFNASITMDPWTTLGMPSPAPPADYPLGGFSTITRPSTMSSMGNRNNTWRSQYRWCASNDSLAANFSSVEGQLLQALYLARVSLDFSN